MKFDLLHLKAGGRVQPGGTFPGAFVAALCLRHASLSRSDESLVLDSTHGRVGITGIAHQMRWTVGPMAGGRRRNILFVEGNNDEQQCLTGGEDFEAQLAYRKA